MRSRPIKSVAVIGGGASGEYSEVELQRTKSLRRRPGAATAAALSAENYFERIQVFERRDTPGGTW
jgi:cation diffusion facilitator CzcD-associated flavoprotein CzcO